MEEYNYTKLLQSYTKFPFRPPRACMGTRLTVTVDDYHIELYTDNYKLDLLVLYMYMLLCLTCFIKDFCIPGMQAEVMLPVFTQT